MSLILLTGNSGAGKSTVCTLLRRAGIHALDADWDGFCGWEDRVSGESVLEPPYPVPPSWLDQFAWTFRSDRVAALARRTSRAELVFLCGSAENERDVRHLFDLVICLVADDAVIERRLRTRTGNAFGTHPVELAAALRANSGEAAALRESDAVVIDSDHPPTEVLRLVRDAARELQ